MIAIGRTAAMLRTALVAPAMLLALGGCLTSESPSTRSGTPVTGYPSPQGADRAESGYPGMRLPTNAPSSSGYPGGGEAAAAATEPGGATTGVAGGADDGAAKACGAPRDGFEPYFDATGGWCLEVPAGFVANVTQSDLGGAILMFARPAEPGVAVPAAASLSIETLGAADGRDASQLADDVLRQYIGDAKPTLERTQARIAGEDAVVVDGLPGIHVLRRAFFVHGDIGYSIVVTPWNDEAVAETQADATALWQSAVESLTFVAGDD